MRHYAFAAGILLVMSGTRVLSDHPSPLYELDFTEPEAGSYTIRFGHPTIQTRVGPFTDALVFRLSTPFPGYDQIVLPLEITNQPLSISFDVLGHALRDSQCSFVIHLDTPEVRSVRLHGGPTLNATNQVAVFVPGREARLFEFADDRAYHFDISLDLESAWWSVAVDGEEYYSREFGATSIQSLRFTTSFNIFGTIPNPEMYVALDNVLVTVVPEPTALALLGTGLGLLVGTRKFRKP